MYLREFYIQNITTAKKYFTTNETKYKVFIDLTYYSNLFLLSIMEKEKGTSERNENNLERNFCKCYTLFIFLNKK